MSFAIGTCCAAVLSQQTQIACQGEDTTSSDPLQKFTSATCTVVEAGQVVVKPSLALPKHTPHP